MKNTTKEIFRQYALILTIIVYAENHPEITEEELQKLIAVATDTGESRT